MKYGVFIHRSDSIYDDVPSERYQFPKQYLGRVQRCVGGLVVYYEPVTIRKTRGYFAVARVQDVIADPRVSDMYIAVIESGSYLDFGNPVPFRSPGGIVERGVLNAEGAISGRAQAAVRPLSAEDFNRIVDRGLGGQDQNLPRVGMSPMDSNLQESQFPFQEENHRDRLEFLGSRIVRDRNFRRIVLSAYDERCAITGLKLINGGGRAEVEAAHIQPVEKNGPDMVSNGLALSGTAHWMFDRGLVGLDDDLKLIVSRQVNDQDAVYAMINESGYLGPTSRVGDRPHPAFLQWHRENCFKQ
jgi:putative restriction endonuclease